MARLARDEEVTQGERDLAGVLEPVRGAAVLLVSEDLDEILELADRVAVMSEGRIAYVAPTGETDRTTIGRHMAGH